MTKFKVINDLRKTKYDKTPFPKWPICNQNSQSIGLQKGIQLIVLSRDLDIKKN